MLSRLITSQSEKYMEHKYRCVSVCVSSPGGVYASMEVCTTSERLLEGMGTATFLSTCRANTACTASVCTSEWERERQVNRLIHAKEEGESFPKKCKWKTKRRMALLKKCTVPFIYVFSNKQSRWSLIHFDYTACPCNVLTENYSLHMNKARR